MTGGSTHKKNPQGNKQMSPGYHGERASDTIPVNKLRPLKSILLSVIALLSFLPGKAQLVDDMDDESRLYAESKQVNQFFRRFNGEEDEKGNRFYPGNRNYRNAKLRKKYFGILFDESNSGISDALKTDFATYLLEKPEATVLDFHAKDWFSEVHATFTMNGKDQPVTLFMEIEKDHLGYKWVINSVQSDMFTPYFVRDTTRIGRFLHPMSHELDFMNLRKAFVNGDSVSQFTARSFRPDHLSVFLYEIKKGNLKFKSVERVKFHFFQIAGWYFEISDFNRPGYNTGWLISNLVRLKDTTEKEMLKNYLYKK